MIAVAVEEHEESPNNEDADEDKKRNKIKSKPSEALSLSEFWPSKLCSFILSSISQCKIGGNYSIKMTENCND